MMVTAVYALLRSGNNATAAGFHAMQWQNDWQVPQQRITSSSSSNYQIKP
jgi:hypothetical protein